MFKTIIKKITTALLVLTLVISGVSFILDGQTLTVYAKESVIEKSYLKGTNNPISTDYTLEWTDVGADLYMINLSSNEPLSLSIDTNNSYEVTDNSFRIGKVFGLDVVITAEITPIYNAFYGNTYTFAFEIPNPTREKKIISKLMSGQPVSEKQIKKVANYIAEDVSKRLGTGDISIVWEDIPNVYTLGYMHGEDTSTIYLNKYFLTWLNPNTEDGFYYYSIRAGAVALIDSIVHEIRHCYQYDSYESGDTRFSKAIKNYVSSSDDYEAYYSNKLEMDARKYARKYTKKYLSNTIS